eukprot:TRINITY_DN1717_c0_g1_i17.p1 TRINITY_DN1717_c0_g1~~TRINITY_DN1717_c0_g1_i17.p1  ORF type:complete len:319 (+),score=150.17 TRINITY_DN1717_c0_g1_i17:148-1104(+)
MGLDFLNKKSWHPGSFENIEKVWLAEQAEKEKIKQFKEHQKKLKEERQDEDLKHAQVEAGLIPESYLKRMDWMYVQSNTKQNTKEDLFGTLLKPSEEQEQKKKLVPIVKDSTVNEEYEAFVRFHEDPLVEILKAQERAKAEVLDNPLKLKEIQREIALLKEGKHKSKDKKHKRHHHRRRKDSRDRSESRSRSRSRHRDRNPGRNHREKEELGPTKELKQSYRGVKEMEALRKRQKNSYRHLSEEERREKVEEMQRDAARAKAALSEGKEEEKERVNPEFIRKMRTNVYARGKMSVEENIRRHKYYKQSLNQIRDQNEE